MVLVGSHSHVASSLEATCECVVVIPHGTAVLVVLQGQGFRAGKPPSRGADAQTTRQRGNYHPAVSPPLSRAQRFFDLNTQAIYARPLPASLPEGLYIEVTTMWAAGFSKRRAGR